MTKLLLIILVNRKHLLTFLHILFIDACVDLCCLFTSLVLFYWLLCVAHTVLHRINLPSLTLSRVYQFSKKHAMEECRQRVALSQGMRAKLEAQRLLLKEKLDRLGSKEPPSALKLDPDAVSLSSITSNVCYLWQAFLSFFLFFLDLIIICSVTPVFKK